MKYQKPFARDLSELSFADGACSSGEFVGVCTNLAGGLAGVCLANGRNAGTCNGNGTSVNPSQCVTGVNGTASNCAPHGGYATPS